MKLPALLVAAALSSSAFATHAANPANPHPDMPGMAAPKATLTQQGPVTSVMNAGGYTYIEVSQGKMSRWLATNLLAVRKGDQIQFDEGMEMRDFYSKSLKRTFPSIYFVSYVTVSKGK